MDRQFFLRAGGELVEVSEEVYKAYYSHRRRERTQRERDARRGLLSYDAWDRPGSNGAEIIKAYEPSPEAQTERIMMTEKLRRVLSRLGEDERELINALYFDGETLSAAALRLGVPRKTLEGRRDKILRKLRIYIDAPDRD